MIFSNPAKINKKKQKIRKRKLKTKTSMLRTNGAVKSPWTGVSAAGKECMVGRICETRGF